MKLKWPNGFSLELNNDDYIFVYSLIILFLNYLLPTTLREC